ncbi:MAG: luciferase family protein [Marmoricola sp.]|nr:luciferase family protein [Marmoricola sp.]
MLIDGNIGGSIDGTAGGDLAALEDQIASAERTGFDGVWTTEVGRDPFLPLALAARQSPSLTLGTAIAVAFARNPMTIAATANDLQALSSGRFVLGLGSQVKAHITRRFGMPWSEPTERMTEFIEAVRAIWTCWQDGSDLSFEGRFYQHTLMTPMFRPAAHPWGAPPIVLAAVGPRMNAVAGRTADGVIVHSFMTERHLRGVTLPQIFAGLKDAPRDRADFTVCLPGLVATGADDGELGKAIEAVRSQIAFYGATPAYRSVLDLHGWGDLHEELHRLSVAKRWGEMTALVDDDVLNEFAAVGSPDDVGATVRKRYADIVDRFTLYAPYPMSEAVRNAVVAALRES